MELFAIGICALCAVLFAALVQKTNKEYALLISLGTAAVLLLFLLERAGPVLQQVEDLAASGPLEGEAVGLMLRAVGITVVGQVVARLCKDAGESALAYTVELAAPLKGLAALLGVVVLCRLGGIFEEGGSASLLAATLACAGVLTVPLLELIQAAQRVIESACVFLGASVPVYSALLLASGNTAAGGSYSFWTLAAGSLIPALSSALLMPLLHMFLLLALASSLCGGAFDKLLQSLYSFAKWALVLAVTLFSGVLSVQTVLNAQVDAASGKAVKFLASSAVPIVGGAFGDAVAAIQNSVEIVKSGVGAFGILAALCIFVPTMLQGALWMGVCLLGQVAAGLFDTPRLGSLFGACAWVAKMVLAVLVSVCAVAVVCAALVLCVKGSL